MINDDFDGIDENDLDDCPSCGGTGEIYAVDGSPADWGEDCYCGPYDEMVECRHCNGTGSNPWKPSNAPVQRLAAGQSDATGS